MYRIATHLLTIDSLQLTTHYCIGAAHVNGVLEFGDIIYAVDGQRCQHLADLGGKNRVERHLLVCRQPVSELLESQVRPQSQSHSNHIAIT